MSVARSSWKKSAIAGALSSPIAVSATPSVTLIQKATFATWTPSSRDWITAIGIPKSLTSSRYPIASKPTATSPKSSGESTRARMTVLTRTVVFVMM